MLILGRILGRQLQWHNIPDKLDLNKTQQWISKAFVTLTQNSSDLRSSSRAVESTNRVLQRGLIIKGSAVQPFNSKQPPRGNRCCGITQFPSFPLPDPKGERGCVIDPFMETVTHPGSLWMQW